MFYQVLLRVKIVFRFLESGGKELGCAHNSLVAQSHMQFSFCFDVWLEVEHSSDIDYSSIKIWHHSWIGDNCSLD